MNIDPCLTCSFHTFSCCSSLTQYSTKYFIMLSASGISSLILDIYEMVRGICCIWSRHFSKSSFYSIAQVYAVYFLCLRHCTISSATSWHHILLVIRNSFQKLMTSGCFVAARHCQCRSGIWINFFITFSLNSWTTDCCMTLFCLIVNAALKKAMHQFVPDKWFSCICSPPGCHFTFFKEPLTQSVTLGFVFLTQN